MIRKRRRTIVLSLLRCSLHEELDALNDAGIGKDKVESFLGSVCGSEGGGERVVVRYICTVESRVRQTGRSCGAGRGIGVNNVYVPGGRCARGQGFGDSETNTIGCRNKLAIHSLT